MDDRYGGRISRQAMSLNDFYNRQFGNVYVFGGTDLRYRTRLLGKHISKMYESRIPTVVFYNAPYNSNQQRILNNLIASIATLIALSVSRTTGLSNPFFSRS